MRNLLLSSCIAFTLCGCILQPPTKDISYDGGKSVLLTRPQPIFGDNFNSFLFKTNITIYGKDFSGLLVTKQMSPQDYRVIFTTELGMKLFDFEFRDTSFTLHYCVPQFNRPKLLKTIQQDIEILLMNNLKDKKFDIYPDKDFKYTIAKLQTCNFYNFYYTTADTRQLFKIVHSKKRRKKTIFTLNNYANDFPSNILIRHCDIKLKIELNLLKKPASEAPKEEH